MSVNRGKQWENKVREDFKRTFPSGTIDRLYDPVGGYSNVRNISDFIGYMRPSIFYIECKSKDGNTFPFSNLSQYDKLVSKVGIPGVRAGVLIWFKDHDKVVYVPIKTITQMKNDQKKSINIKTDLDKYRIFEIPGKKKRVFIECDYSILATLEDGD